MSQSNEAVSELNVRLTGDEAGLDRALTNGLRILDRFAAAVDKNGQKVTEVFGSIATGANNGLGKLKTTISPLVTSLSDVATGMGKIGKESSTAAQGVERSAAAVNRLTREYRAGKILQDEYQAKLRQIAQTTEAGSEKQIAALSKLRAIQDRNATAQQRAASAAEAASRREQVAQERAAQSAQRQAAAQEKAAQRTQTSFERKAQAAEKAAQREQEASEKAAAAAERAARRQEVANDKTAAGRRRAAQEAGRKSQEAGIDLAEMGGRGLTGAVSIPIVATLFAAGRAAISFEAAMRNVNSIAHLTDAEFMMLNGHLIEIAKDPQIRQGPIDLAKAMYDVYSSGFQGAKALDIVKIAAKGASAGITDSATSGRILMAVLNSGISGVTSAAQAMDVLFGIVDRGVVTFPQLATALGPVLPIAAKAKISLQEVGAAVALMTKQGQSADESVTSLTNLITHIAQPSKEAQKAFNNLGIETGYWALQNKGLAGILQEVQDKTKGNADVLKQLIPEQRGTRGLLALLTNGMKDYRTELDFAAKAHDGIGKTAAALAEQNKSLEAQLKLVRKEFEILAVQAGPALLRLFREGLKGVRPFIDAIKELVEAFLKLTPGQQQAAMGLIGLAAAIGPVLLGGAKLARLLLELEWIFGTFKAAQIAAAAASAPAAAGIESVGAASATTAVEAAGASRAVGFLAGAMRGLGLLAAAGAIIFTIQFLWEGLGGDPREGPIGRIQETIEYIKTMKRLANENTVIDNDPRNQAIQSQQASRVGLDTVKGYLKEDHPFNFLPTQEVRNLLSDRGMKPSTYLDGQPNWKAVVQDLQKRLEAEYQQKGQQVQRLNSSDRQQKAEGDLGLSSGVLRGIRIAPGVRLPDKRGASTVAAVSKFGSFGGSYSTLTSSSTDAKGNETLTFKAGSAAAAAQIAAFLRSRPGAAGQVIKASGDGISVMIPPTPAAKSGRGGGAAPPPPGPGKTKAAPSFLEHVPLRDLKEITGLDLGSSPTDASNYQEKATNLDAAFAQKRLAAQEEAKRGGAAFDEYGFKVNELAQKLLLADNAIRNTGAAIETLTPKIGTDEAAYREANKALNAQIELINGKRRAKVAVTADDNASYTRLREQNRATLAQYNADKEALTKNTQVHREAVAARSRDLEALANLEKEQLERSRERNLRSLQQQLAGGKITRAEYEKQIKEAMDRIGKESPDYARYGDALSESENRRTSSTSDLRKKTLRLDGKDFDALREELKEELQQLQDSGVEEGQVKDYGDKKGKQIDRDEFEKTFRDMDESHKAALAEGRESLSQYKSFLLQMLAEAKSKMGETSAEAAKLSLAVSHVDWQTAGEQAGRFREALDSGDISLQGYITQMERLRETIPTIAPEYRRMTTEIEQANRRMVQQARQSADEVGRRFADALLRVVKRSQTLGQAIKQAVTEALEAAFTEFVKRNVSKLVFKYLMKDNGDKLKEAAQTQDKATDKFVSGVEVLRVAVDKFVQAANDMGNGSGGIDTGSDNGGADDGSGDGGDGGGMDSRSKTVADKLGANRSIDTGSGTADTVVNTGLNAAKSGQFGPYAQVIAYGVAIGASYLSSMWTSNKVDFTRKDGAGYYRQIGRGDHTGLIDSGYSGADGMRSLGAQAEASRARGSHRSVNIHGPINIKIMGADEASGRAAGRAFLSTIHGDDLALDNSLRGNE